MLMSFPFAARASTQIYSLSLHDALPISCAACRNITRKGSASVPACGLWQQARTLALPFICATNQYEILDLDLISGRFEFGARSEEHTSELQSHHDLVCRLLLVKKNYCND